MRQLEFALFDMHVHDDADRAVSPLALAWAVRREVAVVPRPDEVMGNRGVAVVVPTDPSRPPSLEELRAFATDDLARFELPEELAVVEALPLTAGHKLDRRRLRDELDSRRSGRVHDGAR
jgi:acyl-CoA synthetase (AMP-forming)/AMP-acid ligase II